MKNSGEARLLLILAAFVLLGFGAVTLLNRTSGSLPIPIPGASASATPPPVPTWDDKKWKAVTGSDVPVEGPANAPFTVVEFADFECPSCRKAYNDGLKKIERSGQIRLYFHHFPWPYHTNAMPAALAAEAARKQGKFWPMYDALFNKEDIELNDFYLTNTAKEVGLNSAQFEKDRGNVLLQAQIADDRKIGENMGVLSTPTIAVRDNRAGKYYTFVGADDFIKQIPFLLGKSPTPAPSGSPSAPTSASSAKPSATPPGPLGPVVAGSPSSSASPIAAMASSPAPSPSSAPAAK